MFQGNWKVEAVTVVFQFCECAVTMTMGKTAKTESRVSECFSHRGPHLAMYIFTLHICPSPLMSCRTVWEMKVMVDGMGVMLHHTEVTAACSTFSFYWMKLFENVSKSKLSTFGWWDNVKCKDVSAKCFVALIPAPTNTHRLADGILPLI